jgi:hypothetical protein
VAGVVCLLVYGSDGLQLVDTLEEERNLADEALMAAYSSAGLLKEVVEEKENFLVESSSGWMWQYIRHAVGVGIPSMRGCFRRSFWV